jgi:hypothetical protein
LAQLLKNQQVDVKNKNFLETDIEYLAETSGRQDMRLNQLEQRLQRLELLKENHN